MQSADSGFFDPEDERIEYVGLENYKRTLSDPKFYKALSNTFIYVVGSVLCILPLGFLLAVSLFECPRILRGILAFCLLIPGLALPGAMSKCFYLFSWKGGGIEPISGDTSWFRPDQLDDGS